MFGRNLDWIYNLGQTGLLLPRNTVWKNSVTKELEQASYAVIGIGFMLDTRQFLLDGMNEKGLGCAALSFPRYAKFNEKPQTGKINIAPLDFVYWLLSNFENINQVREAMQNVNIVRILEHADVHWIVTDKTGESIIIEKFSEDISIFENSIGVLTNAPPFDWQLTNLNQYISVKAKEPEDTYWSNQKLVPVGNALGSYGLPGDYSSPSRLVRAAFAKSNMPTPRDTQVGISEFYHILNNVAVVNGSVVTRSNYNEITYYTSCMDLNEGLYYYNTYYNNRINLLALRPQDYESSSILVYPLIDTLDINYQN